MEERRADPAGSDAASPESRMDSLSHISTGRGSHSKIRSAGSSRDWCGGSLCHGSAWRQITEAEIIFVNKKETAEKKNAAENKQNISSDKNEKAEKKNFVTGTKLQTYAAMILGKDFREDAEKNSGKLKIFLQKFNEARKELDASRPTAVNLSWATKVMYDAACSMAEANLNAEQIADELEKLAEKIYQQDISKNKKMGDYGAEVVPEDAVILTHCNAGALATCGWGTALGVIRSAYRQGKVKMVYSDETRPLLQAPASPPGS